jgi:hypothetical protein
MYGSDLCRVFAEAHSFGLTRKEVIRSRLLIVKCVGVAGYIRICVCWFMKNINFYSLRKL